MKAQAILLTITLNRKTGQVISKKTEETNEQIDYSALIDEYAKKIIGDINTGRFNEKL